MRVALRNFGSLMIWANVGAGVFPRLRSNPDREPLLGEMSVLAAVPAVARV